MQNCRITHQVNLFDYLCNYLYIFVCNLSN